MLQPSQSITLLVFYTYIITVYMFDKYVEKRMDKFYREAYFTHRMNSTDRFLDIS